MPGVIGGMIERPKMTRSMYQALKRHILAEREKKKQEKEQDEEFERQKRERELRKKKAEEESLTLEQTKEACAAEIANLETRLEGLKREKHELFSQLKKVLHQEGETKKKAQLKEQSEVMTIAPQYQHGIAGGHMGYLHGGMTPQQSKYLRPMQHHQQVVHAIKRPRSPSPPPPAQGSAMAYSPYSGGNSKYPAATYATTPIKQEPYPTKESRYGNQSTHVTYATQSAHTYQQAAAQPQTVAYTRDPPAASSTKYPSSAASQSAFSSYPGHYATHQQKALPETHYPAGYRLPAQAGQHGYISTSHSGTSLPLQQQLEHANQKSGFCEDKLKLQQQQIRGIAPVPQNPAVLPHHAAAASTTQKGSIVAGYPVRTQASPAAFPPASSQSAYSQAATQPPRHSYPGQQQARFF